MSQQEIKLLLVDDHPVVRAGLRAMLDSTPDMRVVGEAVDGLEALKAVSSYYPDVVLMDIGMPNMDGMEATRRIKKQCPHTAVVILTMSDNDILEAESFRAGASAFILKDASRDLLIHTIRAVRIGETLIKTSLLWEALGERHIYPATGPAEGFAGGPLIEALSNRERDVLHIMVEGSTNKEIAASLMIGEDTVKKHVQNIMAKMGASDRTQAAVKAVRMGLET